MAKSITIILGRYYTFATIESMLRKLSIVMNKKESGGLTDE